MAKVSMLMLNVPFMAREGDRNPMSNELQKSRSGSDLCFRRKTFKHCGEKMAENFRED